MNYRLAHKRGVASIIGGVFIILILIAGYAFFALSSQATNDLQKTLREVSQLDLDKSKEDIISVLFPYPTSSNIDIVNSGPKLVKINYIGWLNEGEINPRYHFSKWDLEIPSNGFASIALGLDLSGYIVKIITERGNIFTVSPDGSSPIPSVVIGPLNGPAGSTITITGGLDFRSNRRIAITFDQVPVTTTPSPIISDNSGAFVTSTFTIPASALNGSHVIEVSDGLLKCAVMFVIP